MFCLAKIADSAVISKSLIQYRLAQAAEQLYTTQKSVSVIAEETGFTSAGYFCRKFRQHYQMSPNAYRRRKTEQTAEGR